MLINPKVRCWKTSHFGTNIENRALYRHYTVVQNSKWYTTENTKKDIALRFHWKEEHFDDGCWTFLFCLTFHYKCRLSRSGQVKAMYLHCWLITFAVSPTVPLPFSIAWFPETEMPSTKMHNSLLCQRDTEALPAYLFKVTPDEVIWWSLQWKMPNICHSMREMASHTTTHNVQPLSLGKIPWVKPSIIIMAISLVMDDDASEVVVSSCAKGRAVSISHTDSSVDGDSMTRLRGWKARSRALAT